jgi:multidrug resistance protein, MATE family
MSIAGVLSLSEWWFWEAMCFTAGSFGVVQLCAHTIAYNLIPMLFMIPLGTSIGLTVRMGNVIATDPAKAKMLAAWTMLLIVIVGAAVALCLHAFQMQVFKLFTNDPEVIRDCQAIWNKVCYYVFVLYIFGINGAIHRGKLCLRYHLCELLCHIAPYSHVVWHTSVEQHSACNGAWRQLSC